MVFHYTIRGGPCLNANSHITLTSSDITCYVGEDKHENEYLIKYGWPGDVWFHVDSLSSAHVYFRVCTDAAPLKGVPIDDLPVDSVYDMMQIVKHNSISGCKLASTKIVYTAHSNLKKTFQMESGTVTFHDTKLCRYARCDKDRQRVKDLEKTKIERLNVDFYEEMKANERRLIDRKKRERAAKLEGEELGLYDPITDDLRTGRIKATRQGDITSGLDNALAALETVSFAKVPMKSSGDDDDDADAVELEEDVAAWIADSRLRALEASPDVRFLRERGYSSADATAALKSSGSRIAALRTLFLPAATNQEAEASAEEAAEERFEEKAVLQAIFGEDDGFIFNEEEEALFDTIIPIAMYEAPDRYENPPPLLLEIYVDNDIAPLYPHASPVLAVVGGGFPEALVKDLTDRLRREALERSQEEPGDPQIFNLINFLGEEAEKVVEEEATALAAAKKKCQAEAKAAADAKRKAEAEERKKNQKSGAHSSEQERRAYAQEVIANVATSNISDEKKKEAGKKYKSGVSDQRLIDDLFGF